MLCVHIFIGLAQKELQGCKSSLLPLIGTSELFWPDNEKSYISDISLLLFLCIVKEVQLVHIQIGIIDREWYDRGNQSLLYKIIQDSEGCKGAGFWSLKSARILHTHYTINLFELS